MTVNTVGILHPGQMGAAIAACLTGRGVEVLWCPQGRSQPTVDRADRAGLTAVDSIAELAERSALIFSVCPPHAALDVARELPAYHGTYVDANAISPALSRRIGEEIIAGGATYVDGSIVGRPPNPSRSARLYLSGEGAAVVAQIFADTAVDARVLAGDPTSASALKMAYAAWTKGTQALLVAIQQLAQATGIQAALLDEWAISQPTLTSAADSAARESEEKGWRWTAEMEQIATTFADSGLPDGFHRAAAEVFRQVSGLSAVTPETTH